MNIAIDVDESSLSKVLKDLTRNLGYKESRKVMRKGSRASALVMRKAIKASAASVGIPDGMKVRYRVIPARNKYFVGHSVFIGEGARAMDTSPHNIPAVWYEFGTYNRRVRMYMRDTIRRHPNVLRYPSMYPENYGIRPRPFIRPAVERSRKVAETAYIKAVRKAVKEFKVSK